MMARRLTTHAGVTIEVARATAGDEAPLRRLFDEVVAVSGGFPHRTPVDPEEFRHYWLVDKTAVMVARRGERLVGSYFLKPNFPGRAAHVANCGYMVVPDLQGRGIGRALIEHSLELARRCGFDAVQFNLVFADNPARSLYEKLGFSPVGRVPDVLDGEDALIYWHRL